MSILKPDSAKNNYFRHETAVQRTAGGTVDWVAAMKSLPGMQR